MITTYYYCLNMTADDERFVAGALQEFVQHLREDPIKLLVNIKALTDEPELAKEVYERLNRLSDQSYTFSNCAADITGVLPIGETYTARLLVYCGQDSKIAQAAKKKAPWALWGSTCGFLSAIYESNNNFIIWHEVVHLLLLRDDNLDECYEPSPPFAKKGDCDCKSCLMQYAPTEKTVGEWPSLCSKVTRLLHKLVKKDLYFIGFLVNVDDLILKLRVGDGFSIDKKQQQEITPFLQGLDFHYGAKSGFEIINFNPDGRPSGCYCITKHFPELVEDTPQGGIVIPIAKLEAISRSLRDKLRLLRLFKGGNIFMRYSLFYHLKKSIPHVAQVGREYPLTDRTVFQLGDDEHAQAEAFMNNVKIPFQRSFLQLAFDSFELSYETHNQGLAFLSLMISMEAFFCASQNEITYQVSRNAAVLLGKSEGESKEIFDDMKTLYGKRSKLVHGKQDKKPMTPKDVLRLRYYVREAIKSIYKLDLGQKELLAILNKSGFGQSPLPN